MSLSYKSSVYASGALLIYFFVHSFHAYLFSSFYIIGTILGNEYIIENKRDMIIEEVLCLVVETGIKPISSNQQTYIMKL